MLLLYIILFTFFDNFLRTGTYGEKGVISFAERRLFVYFVLVEYPKMCNYTSNTNLGLNSLLNPSFWGGTNSAIIDTHLSFNSNL